MEHTSFLFLLCLGAAHTLIAQQSTGYLAWSNTRKLTVDDFIIETKQGASTTSFGQFTTAYEVSGFSFLTKNFNKKVHNYFIPEASWIDTTADVAQSIRYQQTLFDLAEIYTRQFRRALRENRKRFLKNSSVADELNKEFITAFSKRRIAYDGDTKFGIAEVQQKEWEGVIKNELYDLRDYAYEK